jgi:hypothetical protein
MSEHMIETYVGSMDLYLSIFGQVHPGRAGNLVSLQYLQDIRSNEHGLDPGDVKGTDGNPDYIST